MNDVMMSEKLLESKDQIDKAVFKITVMESEIADDVNRVTTIINELIIPLNDQLKCVIAELEASKNRLSAIISDPGARILEAKIKGLKEKLHDLEKKDPECSSTTCSFITGALRAQSELVELEPRLLNIKTEIETGKPIKQAVAIGYAVQRRAKRGK